jgi:hypothetical protein
LWLIVVDCGLILIFQGTEEMAKNEKNIGIDWAFGGIVADAPTRRSTKANQKLFGGWVVEQYRSKDGKEGVSIFPADFQGFYGKLTVASATKLAQSYLAAGAGGGTREKCTEKAEAAARLFVSNPFSDPNMRQHVQGLLDDLAGFQQAFAYAQKAGAGPDDLAAARAALKD